VAQHSHAVKRRFARVALPKGMLVAWQHSGGRSVSRVATLGLGGLFIATPDPQPAGTVMKIVFDVPGGEVRARAIVKNVKAGQGMAVAFIEMGYPDRARLGQLLKKLA
jgi:PilZ domain